MELLNASVGVLQDLGFTLEVTSFELGVLTGSKELDATHAGQIAIAAGQVTLSALLAIVPLLLVACSNQPNEEIMQGASPVQLRSYQTRVFDSSEKLSMLRSVIATLQDLGFIIDEANVDLGTVTATSASGSRVSITVAVQPRGDKQLSVRASAYIDLIPIEDPEPYQDFFNALEKAVFLTAQQVD